ncbi:Cell division protein FtsK [hydrothermal vent metagenome]|uniref:Cell division protein FtsK n=1 Tax=hydrothermal vent metagenome TaxID=652676 RepID=A0A1W1EE13_9ZZZZ
MKISIIIIAILFMYGSFSTIFHDTALAGDVGKLVGETNIHLFGWFAYINIILLFYPLYKLYTDEKSRKNIDFYLGWILLYIAIVIFESMVLELKDVGFIGTQLVLFLEPLIGKAGLWLLWLMIISLSFVFILDDDFSFKELLTKIKPAKKEKRKNSSKKANNEPSKIATTFKKIFTNPFSSPKLEDEMMPILDDSSEVKRKPKTVSKKTATKKSETKRAETQKVENKKSEAKKVENKQDDILEPDDSVLNEIEIFEEKMIKAKSAKSSKNLSKNVEIVSELSENSKLLDEIEKGAVEKPKNFKLPKIDFLQKAPKVRKKVNEEEIDRKIDDLMAKLQQFRIEGEVVRTYSGPLVTTFEFKPAPNVKVSKILGLQDDLAMALSAETIRIQAPIPGRDVVGIEIPNANIDTIYLREILESDIFKEAKSPLTVALGKDIVGNPFITDIKKLPHVLIAGTTGSGKSVGINAMILSLLYRNDPDQLKLMLIDPKMLEFSMYNDIPHLITPVITEPAKAIAALANMVGEMERRYKLMAESRTKNIENYNEKVKKEGEEPFPFIVIVIDELADLMMNGGKEVELSIARLAQKSRACGIHLIVATQRPSVDVVTGLIKANLPSRLSYRVGQRIDSKVILDAMGAESLLGRGDGLFTPPGSTGLVRIHAPWNTEDEIDKVVEYLKDQRLPEYDESYLVAGGATSSKGNDSDIAVDPLFEDARNIVLTDQKTSISYLQRKLQIGYNRSANIIEQLEAKGILSAPNAKGNREIL